MNFFAEDKADRNKKRNRSERLTQPDSVGVRTNRPVALRSANWFLLIMVGFGPADLGSNPSRATFLHNILPLCSDIVRYASS